MDAAARSRIADPSLAGAGEQRIRWVAKHSPVLNRLARTRLADGSLRGRRVAVVVHLEAKTAYLATLFAEAGAHVVAAGSNPGSTQDSICAALVARGIEVHASHDASREQFDADLLAVADTEPEIVVDDGAELTARILEHRPELAARLAGVTEETTTGVARLRAMEAAGKLVFPAIAANDARCKHLFDNRYGTGQSTLAAIDRLTNLNFAGREFCIVGYGWVGKGLALYARGQGGRVTVVEVDPVAALEAHMDGHRVASLEDALPDADLVIAATGAIDAVPASAVPLLKDGVVLANGGHHEREIAIDTLGEGEEVRPGVFEHPIPGGGSAYVLVDGRQTNVAGGDGHPVEIMDLSFSVQALSAHLLAQGGLPSGLHGFPAELDAEIARTKLATLGIELGEPTAKQREFTERWKV
ncbi:MAG TPA: adenosylhomocysteinase [Gaiellaceae bacterium]|nr:adenosylhomocysteinase [Gaiellaceae bacterium]